MKNIITLIIIGLATIANAQNNQLSLENGKYLDVNGNLYSGVYEQLSNGVKTAELNVENGVLSGPAVYFQLNGNVKETGSFSNGLRSGNWTHYNKDGKKVSEASFLNDKKHGKWMVWDDLGNKRFEMYYNEGVKVGTWKIWDDKGNLTTKEY